MKYVPKKWNVKTPSRDLVNELAKRLKISKAAAAVLVNRGIHAPADTEFFFNPDLSMLYNPFLLPDIEAAVARIRRALDAREKILVYGDRDTDGVTSISIMVRTLKSLGADTLWYIPSEEGYGVHKEIIERYAGQGVKLIITVDCGISALAETEYAREKGIDFVVTDHHEPHAEGLPRAVAVVDPKRQDSKYPFNELAGCAVSLKVSEALMLSFGKYYNEELAVLAVPCAPEGAFQGIGAVIARNGITLDAFSPAAGEDNGTTLARLSSFVGSRRVIVADAGRALGALRPFFDVPEDRVIDLLKVYRDQPSLTADDSDAGRAAPQEARELLRRFLLLEREADVRMSFFRESHLDVVTLGTIADIMPLVNENRILVKHGLKRIPQSRKVGVQLLVEKCLSRNGNNGLTAKSISWNIAPLLNAAGRRGKADLAAELLLTDDTYRGYQLLYEINQLNTERRELQAENLVKFLPLLKEQCDLERDRIFVVTASDVEHGVTGIIASQITRQYHRPTILLIIEGEEAMGAARSVPGFDIVASLEKTSDLLIKFGGHSQAAGLTISVNNLQEFRRRIREIAERTITEELLVPAIEVDAEVQCSEVSLKLYNELLEMEPCGMGNPYPVFALRDMKVVECDRVGSNGDHLKLKIGQEGSQSITAMGWGMGGMIDDIRAFPLADLAVQIELNVWQDRKTLQLVIVDIKASDVQ